MGGTDILKDHAFAKRDLDAFLGRLLEHATEMGPGDDSLLSIPAAAKRARCPAAEVVGLILNRKLTRVRYRCDVPGYLSVRVDLDELKGLVRGCGQDHGGLTLREVERRLGSSSAVVKALTALGHLPRAWW